MAGRGTDSGRTRIALKRSATSEIVARHESRARPEGRREHSEYLRAVASAVASYHYSNCPRIAARCSPDIEQSVPLSGIGRSLLFLCSRLCSPGQRTVRSGATRASSVKALGVGQLRHAYMDTNEF
jgi:hypothetical protein